MLFKQNRIPGCKFVTFSVSCSEGICNKKMPPTQRKVGGGSKTILRSVFKTDGFYCGDFADGAQQHKLYRGGDGEHDDVFHQPPCHQTDKSLSIVEVKKQRGQAKIQKDGDTKPGKEYSWYRNLMSIQEKAIEHPL